jgi:hypothetical protein
MGLLSEYLKHPVRDQGPHFPRLPPAALIAVSFCMGAESSIGWEPPALPVDRHDAIKSPPAEPVAFLHA